MHCRTDINDGLTHGILTDFYGLSMNNMTSPWTPVECDQCMQPRFMELVEKQWFSMDSMTSPCNYMRFQWVNHGVFL